MQPFVALLRGVNVGTAKRVPMAVFRELLSGLGFAEVRTLLNSGNAVFLGARAKPERHAAAVRGALETALGFDVPVIVRAASDFNAAVAGNPFGTAVTDPSRLLVAFTQDARALADLSSVSALVAPPEQFVVGAHAAYLHCPDGILASRAGEALLGKAGRLATTRNWATTLKLQALLDDVRARR